MSTSSNPSTNAAPTNAQSCMKSANQTPSNAQHAPDTTSAHTLFTQALALTGGWHVVCCQLDCSKKKLTLELDFPRGQHFACPKCQAICPVHDTEPREWRHINFFDNECVLQARVPRTRCQKDGVLQVGVPWAREGIGFTLLFEAMAVMMCQQMPVSQAAEKMQIHDTRMGRIVEHYVEEARAKQDWSDIEEICLDETSAKSGHRYVTSFLDAKTRRLLFMVEGKGADTVHAFVKEMKAHNAVPEQIKQASLDMSSAFIKGVKECFPNASLNFDPFHIMCLAGDALDDVRKELAAQGADLKGAMWAMRGNEWTLDEEYKATRKEYCKRYPVLGKALGLREMLQDIIATGDESDLKWWCKRAKLSRLAPFKKVAQTLQNHWEGVISTMKTKLSNGPMEAINGVLQLIKRGARGFRTFKRFSIMAYLKAGKLIMELPNPYPTKCAA